MNIDSIRTGYVIDHIEAGKAMQLFMMLGLDTLDCPVALIKNAASGKMGKKDIIKIDADIPVDLDLIGYVSPNVTVNVIRDGVLVEKKKLDLPKRLVNIIRCKNPRCITTTEQGIRHIFTLDGAGEYRCVYCDTKG